MSMNTDPHHLTVHGGSGVMTGHQASASQSSLSFQPPRMLLFTGASMER